MRLLVGILGSLGLSLLAAEFSAVAPWLAERLLRGAARVLPAGPRHRYLQEWLGELDAAPGQLFKLLFAAKVALCAPATRRELQGGDSLVVVCAGINRHGEGDERALHRRSSDPRWPRVMRRRS
jgi:hypothetical protein